MGCGGVTGSTIRPGTAGTVPGKVVVSGKVVVPGGKAAVGLGTRGAGVGGPGTT